MGRSAIAIFFIAVFLLLKYGQSFDPKTYKPPVFVMGRPLHGLKAPAFSKYQLSQLRGRVLSGTIEQPVDHFNEADTRTWLQYYYYNIQWYKPGAPIFLMIGGEAPEDGSWISVTYQFPFVQWALEHDAAVYSLEHRYYGRSRPFEKQTTENLKYLSSRQALADTASFINYINKNNSYVNPKWIVFGGSYAGMLAAWMREKYPQLVIGAVGSSAPIQATLDFHEFLEVVEASLRSYNNECADAVGQAFDNMTQLIWTEEGRNTLSDIFKLQPRLNETPLRPTDIQFFFSAVYDNIAGSVQYNRVNADIYATDGGIPEVCGIMVDKTIGSPVDRLQAVNVYLRELFYGHFDNTPISYDDFLDYLRDETYSSSDPSFRSWTWQTCTEFSFFQSTDTGKNIFRSVTPNNIFIDLCTDVFGSDYNVRFIQDKVRETNTYYGGRDRFTGTNVVLPNGNVDPWHALGKYSMDEPSLVPYLINGTAHCADMYPPSSEDVPGLKMAQELIANNIKRWINGALTVDEQQKSLNKEIRKSPETKNFVSITKEWSPDDSKIKEREKKELKFRLEHPGLPRMIHGRPIRGFLPPPPGPEVGEDPPGLVRGKIIQPLDHFDQYNMLAFEQRYWMNPQFYQPGGPQFLFISGEGIANEKWVKNDSVQIMRSAKKFNAAVFMIEHRFYGDSQPTESQSLEGLKYLSSKQALADIAGFIKTMNYQQNYENPRWVVFGGSYAGMLAAWFRQNYPELAVGAISSSAPIEAKVDFFEYLLVVQDAYKLYSQSCVNNIEEAFNQINKMVLTPQGRVDLSNIFSLSPPWSLNSEITDTDIQYFSMSLYGIFQGAVQYNNDNSGKFATEGGIKEICNFMENEDLTILQRVAAANAYIYKFDTDEEFTSTDNLYQNYVNDLFFDSSWRAWSYQTCTEFGFYQSTDSGKNIFGSTTPVNFDLNTCADVFNITPQAVFDAVQDIQNFYGGSQYFHGTNVVFSNGNIDPWSALGEYNNNIDPSVIIVRINGTAHCADMYPPRDQDIEGLAAARQIIDDNIQLWISPSIVTTVSPSSTVTTLSPSTVTTVSPSSTVTTVSPSTVKTVPPSSVATTVSPSSTITTVSPSSTVPTTTSYNTASIRSDITIFSILLGITSLIIILSA